VLAEEGGVRVFYISAPTMSGLVDRLARVLSDQEDVDAANKAIAVANAADTRVHTYLAKSGADAKTQAANKAEFAR
jgi:hypothetical protein